MRSPRDPRWSGNRPGSIGAHTGAIRNCLPCEGILLRVADPKRSSLRASIEKLLGHLVPGEAASGEPELRLIDVATHALDSTLDRWVRTPAIRQLIGALEHDALTGPGEWVELRARLGVAGTLAERATFTLGGLVVAEVAVAGESEIHAVVRAPATGVYPVGVELSSTSGHLASALVGQRLLQVTGTRPVVLFHAALLLADEVGAGPALASLRALVAAGFELAYFDIHAKNRDPQIREALAAHALPAAAMLTVSTERQDLGNLQADFGAMFIATAVRRLRGRGVPITMVVSDEFAASPRGGPSAVTFLTPDAALEGTRSAAFTVAHRAQGLAFHEQRERADRITWRLDQATESELVAGNDFHAELDNGRARERLLALVGSARRSVHLQVYIVRPDEFADRLVVALIQRARAGVRVRFMVDALYSETEVVGRNNPLLLALAAEPNIDVLVLGRIESRRDVDLSRLKQRDHRKLLIVDGVHAIVSGRNVADGYYRGFGEVAIHDHTAHERIPWLDAHIEVQGPLVADVERSFISTWREHGGPTIDPAEPVRANIPRAGGVAGRLVIHRGLADTHAMSMYEAMLECAERHVYIVNDFPIVTALGHAIRRVLARGVRVQLLTGNAAARRSDGSFFPAPLHRTLFELMVKARLEPLLAAGVEVYEFVPPASPLVVARGGCIRPYVHAKVMSVDGLVCSVGSANLDASASFWESEANVVVQDAGFAGALEATLATMVAGSFRIDPLSPYWTSERAQRALVATLWPDSLYS